MFAAAIQNPQLLLGLFLIACTAIYIFVCFYIVVAGINQNKTVGYSTRNWLIANGIVMSVYAFIITFSCLTILSTPSAMGEFVSMMYENFNGKIEISEQQIEQYLSTGLYISLLIAIILLIHAFLSYRVLNMYAHLFDKRI
jgi:hypothetical protein